MRIRFADGTVRRPEEIIWDLVDRWAEGKISEEGCRAAIKEWFPHLTRDDIDQEMGL
jgi:hypothetical protein